MSQTTKKKILDKGPPGRPKHEIWTQGFRRVLKHCDKTHRTVHAAFCVICSKLLCNTASKRLSAHRRICSFDKNTVEVIKNDIEIGKITKIVTPENSTTITFVDMDESNEFHTDPSGSMCKSETTTYTFIDSDTEMEEHYKNIATNTSDYKLDIVLAKFFIGCNIPFAVADSPYFKNFCLSLNSQIKPITSAHLSGPLLNTLYSKINTDIKISSTSILLIDGWKNDGINSKTITVMLRTEKNETIFMDNYELSTCIKNSMLELTNITKSCIMEANERFKTEVYAVILGNNYVLKLNNEDELWQFPCNLQLLNGLVQDYVTIDFLNTICKILKHCNDIFKEDDLDDKLSQEKRWSEVKYIMEFCNTNLETIRDVLSNDDYEIKLSKEIKCNFFEDDFVQKIQDCNNFMDKINELLLICNSPKSNIADAIEQWLSLSSNELINDDKLKKCQEKAISVQGLVANYLHPACKGQKLNQEQMILVDDFLVSNLDPSGLDSLNVYSNNEGIFFNLNQKGNLTAKTYWGFARRTHNNLASLALKLLSIPAAITSNFSYHFNDIKNNTLQPEQMRKLFSVYYYLKEKEDKADDE